MKTLSLTLQRLIALNQISAKPLLHLFASLLLAVITIFGAATVDAATATVSAGEVHTVALKSDGSVWAWGNNGWGRLGNDGLVGTYVSPVQVSGLSGVVAVSANVVHTAALKSDGSVWAWGYNGWGQLGNASTASSFVPVQVSGLSGVVAVSAGPIHTVAVKSDGSVWAWGGNNVGQLGNASTASSFVPLQISGLSGVVAVSASFYYTAALKSDGSVWAWGNNDWGQLGNDSTASSLVPVQVVGLSGVVAVSASYSNYTVAVKSDGSVWAWGNNDRGQLGNDSTASSLVPVQVVGLSGVVAVSAGETHTAALKSDGSVWAWGNNDWGQLGNDSTASSLVPVQVLGLSGVVAVSAGRYYTAAVKSDGSVWAWGINYHAQLGNNSTVGSLVPVQVVGPDGQGFLNLGATLTATAQLDQVTAISNAITVSVGTLSIGSAPATIETEVKQGITTQTQRQTIAVGDSTQQVFSGLQNNVPATVTAYVLDSQGNRALTATAINATPQAVPETCKDFTKPLPPILLLHGFNSDKGIWLNTETQLKQCVGPKVESKTLSDGYGALYENPFNQLLPLANWIDDVKLSTGASRVILVGHSQGGILARLYAQTGGDPMRFCEFYQAGAMPTVERIIANSCTNPISDGMSLFSGDQNGVAGIITYGTPHKGVDGVPSAYPYLARGSGFLQTLNDFQTFPIPENILMTNIVGRTGTSATDDCLVDTDSQSIKNISGYSGSAVETSRTGVKHATTNYGCLRAIGKTPEAQDFAGIAEALGAQSLKINVHSPVDIVVTDPAGRTVSKSDRGIWGATYIEAPDDTGDLKDVVTIPFPERGQYQILVIPNANASPTATFSISTEIDGQETMLVENVPVSETTSSPFFVATSVSNLRPLANAGSDLIARRGSLVRLSAASSKDPDAGPTPLSYSWVTLAPPAGIALNGDNSSQPTFQPSIAGRYTFGLTVHDGLLTSVMDTVLVTVPKLGDIDRDDDVDSDDLNLILAARNTPANGPNDLRDLNGDGKIDALDSRKLVTLCTRPRCATR